MGAQLRLARRPGAAAGSPRSTGTKPPRRVTPAQRFPRADDDGVALGDELDHVSRGGVRIRRRNAQAGALPDREERQALVAAEHRAVRIGDVAGCETSGQPGAKLGC